MQHLLVPLLHHLPVLEARLVRLIEDPGHRLDLRRDTQTVNCVESRMLSKFHAENLSKIVKTIDNS